jgi:succinoglycan biosynthesis transport protein ExoP
MNGPVRSPGRLEQATGRTVVASLPTLPELRLEGTESVPENAREIDRAVSLLLKRLRMYRADGAPLALLVTSGDDARNKSALALYLALCGTLDRQKVLLVDADPRGLVTQAVCSGQAPDGAGETIGGQTVTHIDSFPGLRVISPLDGAAVEELFAARFSEAIAGCDLIIIDAPLLGADAVTERLIADGRIGAIVFTASATRSTVGAVRRAIAPIARDQRLTPVLCDEEAEVSSG